MIKKLLLAFSFLTVSMVFAQKNNEQQAVAEASEKLRSAMISGGQNDFGIFDFTGTYLRTFWRSY